ncbi:MAG: glycoside hydrolase family 15 protein [Bryobacterales bacterium]|nr:glycoside hydrolase family 15 protein [Bryobacterales bacterium]
MPYQPIEDYGVIGNMHTIALAGKNGSIDWFCYPNFDSPSVFAAILDDQKGGYFRIFPLEDELTRKQVYWPGTNVLVTRFLSTRGVAEIVDYMPVKAPLDGRGYHGLIRRLKMVRGEMRFRMECFPAFDYGRVKHRVDVHDNTARFRSGAVNLGLEADFPLQCEGDGVTAEFVLNDGSTANFELHGISDADDAFIGISDAEGERLFRETVQFWRDWLSQCTYRGRWREIVERSALVLKLLTFAPTGAIVAAPTTSLPESIAGSRNWDYRYTWIRDAAFTLYALMRIGFTSEAAAFMSWIDDRCHHLEPDGSLELMYAIDGSHVPEETELHHLEGFRGSRPVRIGNGAHSQLQLDIYGELMDSVYLFNKYGVQIPYEQWTNLRRLTNWLCDNWRREDEGIWEVRSGSQHFVYSKMMCWVAIDRALRLADKRSFPADREKWLKVRDEIYEDILENGWSEERQAFVQYYGSDSLDASALMMPLVFFLSPGDPKMLKTLNAINRPPSERGLVSNGMVYRYNIEEAPDGFTTGEGTFNICTFWLVEAMTRAGAADRRYLEEARLLFEQMLSYANHLGLFSEQTGPRGEALGNFPQAFTHLALISAAFNLDRSLGSSEC